MLDVGCRTGSLVIGSPGTGSEAFRLDISGSMHDIAGKKGGEDEDSPSSLQGGVVEMDNLSGNESPDTLVLSELYPDERRWAPDRMHGMLRNGGKVVIAAEVLPGNLFKRLFYRLVRLSPPTLLPGKAQGPCPILEMNPPGRSSGWLMRGFHSCTVSC